MAYTVTIHSALTADCYPPYLYNKFPDVELLSQKESTSLILMHIAQVIFTDFIIVMYE